MRCPSPEFLVTAPGHSRHESICCNAHPAHSGICHKTHRHGRTVQYLGASCTGHNWWHSSTTSVVIYSLKIACATGEPATCMIVNLACEHFAPRRICYVLPRNPAIAFKRHGQQKLK